MVSLGSKELNKVARILWLDEWSLQTNFTDILYPLYCSWSP